MRPFDLFTEAGLANEAERLAQRWAELRSRRVSFLAGCGCGLPAAHVSPAEVEADIVAYLRARHRNGAAAAARILDGAASLGIVLERLQSALAASPEFAPLLKDIARSLSSFEGAALRCVRA